MQTFIYNHKKISYRNVGSGVPVLLLHGFAEDGDVWKHQADFLQSNCRLIIPDLPGSGQSERLEKNGDKEITMADYAGCMFGLLQHEKIERCFVFGHSMGGYIMLALAEQFPQLIQGFGFVQSTAFADSEAKRAMRAKGIKTIEEYGSYAFIKSTTPSLFSDAYKTLHANEIELLIHKGEGFEKAALQQYYNAMMLREDKTSVLRSSPAPVLFIMGKEDKAAPLADVLQQAHLPSVSYIHIIENTGHMALWERSDKVNECLLTFIQDITAA